MIEQYKKSIEGITYNISYEFTNKFTSIIVSWIIKNHIIPYESLCKIRDEIVPDNLKDNKDYNYRIKLIDHVEN